MLLVCFADGCCSWCVVDFLIDIVVSCGCFVPIVVVVFIFCLHPFIISRPDNVATNVMSWNVKKVMREKEKPFKRISVRISEGKTIKA